MSLKVQVSGSGSVNVTGQNYQALSQPLNFNKNVGPFTTANANNAALGANECVSYLSTIASSSSEDIDLTSLTDICLQSGVSLARVKGYLIRLLSVADDSVNGTACTGVTIDGAGTNLIALPGLGSSQVLGNGEFIAWATPNAAGVTVDSTHKIIHIVNNDAAHSACIQLTVIGGTT
jgi:hypothetical protein